MADMSPCAMAVVHHTWPFAIREIEVVAQQGQQEIVENPKDHFTHQLRQKLCSLLSNATKRHVQPVTEKSAKKL